MKVYLEPYNDSRGIMRVRDALVKYAPSDVQIVKTVAEADLVILHVFGRHDRVSKDVARLKSQHKAYAIVQYAIRSTQRADTHHWMEIWSGAKAVWSYYDLASHYADDYGVIPGRLPFPFYDAPLGVEPTVFEDYRMKRKYIILASSQHALSESVRECAIAALNNNQWMIHLGADLRRPNTKHVNNITDQELAQWYSQCEFVSGLRRIEGFECPAIEGLMCGARPVLFDKPHYRKWYGELAEYIVESDRDSVIKQLELLFKIGARPVTEQEKALARERFDWSIILKGFWERINMSC